MQYMLLLYGREELAAELPDDEAKRFNEASDRWMKELARSGHLRGTVGLQPASTATTLRKRDGRLVIIDGPFAEVDEELRGYQIVECRDLDEALAIASRFPALGAGYSLEVRPVIPQ
jgi:hypothetical protein